MRGQRSSQTITNKIDGGFFVTVSVRKMTFLKEIQTIARAEMEFAKGEYEEFLEEFIGPPPLGEPLGDFDWAFPEDTSWKTLDELFKVNQKFIEHYGWGYGQPQDTYELHLRYTIYKIRVEEQDLFRAMWEEVCSHKTL